MKKIECDANGRIRIRDIVDYINNLVIYMGNLKIYIKSSPASAMENKVDNIVMMEKKIDDWNAIKDNPNMPIMLTPERQNVSLSTDKNQPVP